MGWLGDLLALWDRGKLLPKPGEMDDLRTRLAKLEAAALNGCPPECCEACGARAARLAARDPIHSVPPMQQETWHCQACNTDTVRLRAVG